jgi:hypothetical protein
MEKFIYNFLTLIYMYYIDSKETLEKKISSVIRRGNSEFLSLFIGDNSDLINHVDKIIIEQANLQNFRYSELFYELGSSNTLRMKIGLLLEKDPNTSGIILPNLYNSLKDNDYELMTYLNMNRDELINYQIPFLLWISPDNFRTFASSKATDLWTRRPPTFDFKNYGFS